MAESEMGSDIRKASIPEIRFEKNESDVESVLSPTANDDFSDIHNYVITSLPRGHARRQILNEIIDIGTPSNSRPPSPLLSSRNSSVVGD